ncbi:GATA type zinc finger transcription factor family protein [Medicago truncatula]|uniref:GATA type zinc finger transcription factor family protein n=1 Tax=Medicago truncatula TaxID=3880 RepID=G7IPG2_MEDTR|nr:GATA type zinc finger transcription factor family protein [Medicago truncatula]
MYCTDSFHVRADQEMPLGVGRRRYIRRGRARPSDPTTFCTNFHCKTRNTPMWRSGPMGPKETHYLLIIVSVFYKKHMVRRDVPAASGSVPPPGTMGGDPSSSTC